MTKYMVGLKLSSRSRASTTEANDALIAALKSKLENPEAAVSYVRKCNRRGDRGHPHEIAGINKSAGPLIIADP